MLDCHPGAPSGGDRQLRLLGLLLVASPLPYLLCIRALHTHLPFASACVALPLLAGLTLWHGSRICAALLEEPGVAAALEELTRVLWVVQ